MTLCSGQGGPKQWWRGGLVCGGEEAVPKKGKALWGPGWEGDT